jgi:hypothetical protein
MAIPDGARALERDLHGIFGSRLQSLVIYGQHAAHDGATQEQHGAHGRTPPTRTLAIAASLTLEDLRAIASHVERWHDAGLATPLLLEAREFERSLDVFPLEFGAIIADHIVVSGDNPFASMQVDAADVRRACEVQARSHLLHLREGFLETRGRDDALSLLIVESAPAFAALVTSLARLGAQSQTTTAGGPDPAAAARHIERTIGVSDGTVAAVVALARAHDLPSAEGARLFAPYLAAVEKIVSYVDGWIDAR